MSKNLETYEELIKQKEEIENKLKKARKNERTQALKKVRDLCKEFGFTAGMLKNYLAKGRRGN